MRRRWQILVAMAVAVLALAIWAPLRVAPPISVVIPPGQIEGNLPVAALGLNIPWAVGGDRIERDGTRGIFGGEWPNVPFRGLRLWDTRTAWLNLQPARDQWNFAQLDSLVQKATENGITDVTLVLGGTPQWAASKVAATDAPWMGPGSASMPASMDDWRTYVDTVVRRYQGRITSYEIGNEPNLLTFWSGTPEQYSQFVLTAAQAIRAADPKATILVNGALVRGKSDLAAIGTWLAPLAAAGGTNAVDAVSVHFYPMASKLGDDEKMLAAMNDQLAAAGWSDLPKWITEVNIRSGSAMASADQKQAVATLAQQMLDNGFERAYWYAWTDLGSLDLIQFQPFTPGSVGLTQLS
jgi:hypothetical protein